MLRGKIKKTGGGIILTLAIFSLLAMLSSAGLSLAQMPTPPGKGTDRPIPRTAPRTEIYENMSKEFGIPSKEARALVATLEDKGFLLREAVMLVILANERAEKLIKDGKFAKNDKAKAMHDSAAFLYDLVEKEGLGWITLSQKVGVPVLRGAELKGLIVKASTLMGQFTQRAPVAGTPEQDEEIKEALAARQKSMAERKSKEGVRQGDKTQEEHFAKEAIVKNLQKELAVDKETVEGLMGKLEGDMPLRESVMLMVVSNGLALKLIQKGDFTKQQKKEALLYSVDFILPFMERGEGWGDVGKRVGVEGLSGVNLNKKANAILGQK